MKNAIKYYEKAKLLGSKEAVVKLGQMYVKGVPGLIE